MSFSSEVKEELVQALPEARHCQIAELAAILECTDAFKANGIIEIVHEMPYVADKCEILLEKLFNIKSVRLDKQSIKLEKVEEVAKISQTIKHTGDTYLVNPMVMKSPCCKRAYLRGAFLATGSISNPEKGYHLEYVCQSMREALQIQEALASFSLMAKTVARKKYQIVYIKESEGIVDILNVIGAHKSLLELENLRILKDMRNSINRQVNCETANITKTVNAATKQIQDIEYIRDHYGFENLPDNLRQMAEVRLELREATLKELGEALDPVVGKSGVNHRLRKLGEIAEKIRNK